MALGILTEIETFRDYFSLQELPTTGSPDWRYHDLWDLNERALLEQRRELGMEGRALVERYHATSDLIPRGGLLPRLSALYRRRQAILQELGTRDQIAVTHALFEHRFPELAERRRREIEEMEQEEERQRQQRLEARNAREEAIRQTLARMDELLEQDFPRAPLERAQISPAPGVEDSRQSAAVIPGNGAVSRQSRASGGAPIPAHKVNPAIVKAI
jgi:hypothetical protein